MHKNLEFPITIRKRMNGSNMILSTKTKTSESTRGKKSGYLSSIFDRRTSYWYTDHGEIGGSIRLEQFRGWVDRRRMFHLARRELLLYVVAVHVATRRVVDQREFE